MFKSKRLKCGFDYVESISFVWAKATVPCYRPLVVLYATNFDINLNNLTWRTTLRFAPCEPTVSDFIYAD